MSVADHADRHFHEGYNCCQSTLLAVAEAHDVGCEGCIPAVAYGMGGGIGHTGRTCGAVTGAVMALGLAVDRFTEGDRRAKKTRAYELGGAFLERFAERFGTSRCERLIGLNLSEPGSMERFLASGAFDETCTPCVRWAAREASRVIQALR